MFKCENCSQNVPPLQPTNYVIVLKEDKVYLNTVQRGNYTKDIQSKGWEIKKQLRVCPDCYSKLTGLEARKAIPKEEITPPKKKDEGPDKRKFDQNKRKPVVEVVNKLKK